MANSTFDININKDEQAQEIYGFGTKNDERASL